MLEASSCCQYLSVCPSDKRIYIAIMTMQYEIILVFGCIAQSRIMTEKWDCTT